MRSRWTTVGTAAAADAPNSGYTFAVIGDIPSGAERVVSLGPSNS